MYNIGTFGYTYILYIIYNVVICIHRYYMLRALLVFFPDLDIGVIGYFIFSTRRIIFCFALPNANGAEDFAEKSYYLYKNHIVVVRIFHHIATIDTQRSDKAFGRVGERAGE